MVFDEDGAEDYFRVVEAVGMSFEWFNQHAADVTDEAFAADGVVVNVEDDELRVHLAVLRADIDALETFLTDHGYTKQ